MHTKSNISVIGAGITGVTTAYYLAKQGYNVTIYDERRYPAMATSYANGGQLSASNAEVWNSWRNVQKGVKWLAKSDAPLKINPMPSWEKYSWFIKFILNIKHADKNTEQTCRWALQAHDLYKNIATEENINFDKVEKGILHVYSDKDEFENAHKVNEVYKKAGLNRWAVTAEECFNIEPALKRSNSLIGGFYNTSDYTGDIHKFCIELEKVLENKYNVTYSNAKITDLNQIDEPVVVCAGIGSRALAKTIGDDLPIYPVKGYSITITVPDPDTAPWVSMLDDKAKIVTARLGADRLRVAGTAEFTGYNTDIKQARVKPLIKWAEDLFPNLNTEIVVPWAGLRPMTPNMMPIVRRSTRKQNVWYNTGHGHLGWTLSAYTAQKTAESIDFEI